MRYRPKLSHAVAALLMMVVLFLIFHFNNRTSVRDDSESFSPDIQAPPLPTTQKNSRTLDRKKLEDNKNNVSVKFSEEMSGIVSGIQTGRTLNVRVGDFEGEYLFRSIDITEERFQVSTGPFGTYPVAYEIFEGRQILPNGSLSEEAKLAVVNDTLSIAFTNELGNFLIERDENGEMVAIQLSSTDPESDLGAWVCQHAHDNDVAGVSDISGNMEKPRNYDVTISLGTQATEVSSPETEAAQVSHPFFRLGTEYDASLKDISVLMISGSTQTGSSANLSSRAASYFTYAAFAADVYERQLGLRFQLQELILIANDSGQPDVEYDDSTVPNDTNSGMDDLNTVRDWCNIYRPQGTYQWGHVAAWTLVDSDVNSTIGWAYISSYGSSFSGFSVNERNWDWRVLIHELGHNVGANHTNGGTMNPSISSQESFFTENLTNGGFTAASQIYDYMSSPTRNFITGPANLRDPDEMPFGTDDFVSTPINTSVTFNPLANDAVSTPLFGMANSLRLVEVGQIFPVTAGTATVSDDNIVFTPSMGYTGRVWFSYTLGGNVGNNGDGWVHSADVIITVGGDSTNPNQNPSIATVDDILSADFSGDVRLNPLLNDEGSGRLWADGVDAISDFITNPVAESYSEGAFFLVSASVINGNGSVILETADKTRNGTASVGNTGYLVYSPGANEPDTVEIQYTVEDENGNQATGMIFLINTDSVSISTTSIELIETEGRVVTLVITRSGSIDDSERVDFSVTGDVSLGLENDIAISGFDSFDASVGTGSVTIPAGQLSVDLKVSAMNDQVTEAEELVQFKITALETLVIDSGADAISLSICDTREDSDIVYLREVFSHEGNDVFPLGAGLANGWINDSSSPGVWTADGAGTVSSNTGPNFDNTLGTGSGRYLYREATNNFNQRADLVSPVVNLSGAENPTLEFYYHMFGADMGQLHIDIFSDGIWHLDVLPVLDGQQQTASFSDWLSASTNLSVYRTDDFQVRFRGVTGPGFTSDMAIDDISITEPLNLSTEDATIEGQPQSVLTFIGSSAYFSTVARAFPTPSYVWKKDGIIISGATRSVLFIDSVSLSDVGLYTCEVTSGTTVTSSSASLTIKPADQDGDGLADSWEQDFFGDLDETGTGDSDHDGVVNFFEYAFGTAPDDPDDNLLPTVSIMEDMGNEYAVITYSRITGGAGITGVDYTAGGLRYTVEYDTDLIAPWSTGNVVQLGPAVSNSDGTTETVTVRLNMPIQEQSAMFMRVRITSTP